MINKPTLVSSSMNIPTTSWSKEIVNGSSATTVGTTVITYSQSEIPNKESNSVANKPTANTATNQHTTVINNNHSTNQGGVTVVGNNNNNDNNAQGSQMNRGVQVAQSSNNVENNQLTANGQNGQSGKNSNGNNDHGENLPQTGEAGASALIALGVILIVGSTIVFYIKQR